MANSFSLLRLPNEEQIQVLRCMDGTSLLLLSLISHKAKDLVKTVRMKPSSFHARMGADICLHMPPWGFFLRFYKDPQDNMRMLVKPDKVWISMHEINHRRTPEMELPNSLEIQEWYQHILYILNIRQPTQIGFYRGCERFDLESIKTTFGKIENLVLHFAEPRDHAREVLNTFLPGIEQLRIIWNPYPSGDTRLRKLLIQNFDSIDFGNFGFLFVRFNLEELLICNARYIKLGTAETFERVNRFLKLWIKGANPRLRKLTIEQRPHFNAEEILKGIRIHREIPREENIVYEGDVDRRFAFRTRAVDIERCDGTIGTAIMIGSTFSFLVWD